MPVVKVLELVGTSNKDWSDAANQAVREASSRLGSIVGVEVLNWTANVKDGAITEYKADVKVAYLDDPQ
ncbi:MAG: dodecin family protein [Bacillota bacterium]|jgi:flavin-binding protein dodecin|nr:dodecin domain-containing protein [Candidatus Fermentithermobacillaceae bacterium]